MFAMRENCASSHHSKSKTICSSSKHCERSPEQSMSEATLIPRSTVSADSNKTHSSVLDKSLDLSFVEVVLPGICRTEKLMNRMDKSDLSTESMEIPAPAIDEGTGVRSTPYTRCHGRWRKRLNHKLEYLRQQVIDLEAELEVLRKPTTIELEDIDSNGALSWERIAPRQGEQVDVTLIENVQL